MTEPTNRAREVLAALGVVEGFTEKYPHAVAVVDPGAILAAMEAYRAEGVAEERERCAALAQKMQSDGWTGMVLAGFIRRRTALVAAIRKELS